MLYNFAELDKEKWLWLSEHPENNKYDWPRWVNNWGNIPTVKSACFACEATRRETGKVNCSKCPFEWAGAVCTSPGTLYNRWMQFHSCPPAERTKFAFKIANLEWKGQKIFEI